MTRRSEVHSVPPLETPPIPLQGNGINDPVQPSPETNVTPPRAKRSSLDVELQTLAKINRLLAGVTEEEADRIVAWCVSRYRHPDGMFALNR